MCRRLLVLAVFALLGLGASACGASAPPITGAQWRDDGCRDWVHDIYALMDAFISGDYLSSVVGFVSFVVFAAYFYFVRYGNKMTTLLVPFIVTLIVVVNAAWFTGGGLTLTNSITYLLAMMIIIIIAPKTSRLWFLMIIFINLIVLTSLEFFQLPYTQPGTLSNRRIVVYSIVLFVDFGIAAYVLLFFKNQYELERETVRKQNLALEKSFSEIESQNEELVQFQEEVMAQRDFIEEKNKKLESQAIELEQVNQKIQSINNNLEMTVEERTRRLKDLNQDLDLLIYRSSHDFRRPITTLMGLNEIARLTIKDDESKKLFEEVHRTAINMDKMLLKFFMLYNINHFRTIHEGNSLEDILGRLEKELVQRHPGAKIQVRLLTKKYHERDSRNSLVEIILENLIENALIYNSKDEVIIDLDIYEKNGFLHIIHSDNGNGIPSEYYGKIFEMYFRGSTLSVGNGLGLYVVKRAADLLEAMINVDSKEGEFTRFAISFKI